MGKIATQALPLVATAFGSPIAGMAVSAATTGIDGLNSISSTNANTSLRMQQAQADANLRMKELNEIAKIEEQERLRNLKSAMARQRASFGARGLSSNSGSSQAVLNGLLNESDESKKTSDKLKKLKEQNINNGLTNQLNLLKLSQEEEKDSFFKLI